MFSHTKVFRNKHPDIARGSTANGITCGSNAGGGEVGICCPICPWGVGINGPDGPGGPGGGINPMNNSLL
ncbi:hypothetical protein FHS15_000124 [Paenibacillus castaneae]|uniref:hypothetical protein n=1 Tax=Paenibacillus castaneae TaxID=474957 RepID=UPI001ABB66BD|nr:hypothetical protein [Paenibacillus castaneae]